jgi:hypothetical protein
VVDIIWDGFVETAKEIQQEHGTKKAQTVGRHCSWCDYDMLCKAEATGSDMDFVMRSHYTTEEEKRIIIGDDRAED